MSPEHAEELASRRGARSRAPTRRAEDHLPSSIRSASTATEIWKARRRQQALSQAGARLPAPEERSTSWPAFPVDGPHRPSDVHTDTESHPGLAAAGQRGNCFTILRARLQRWKHRSPSRPSSPLGRSCPPTPDRGADRPRRWTPGFDGRDDGAPLLRRGAGWPGGGGATSTDARGQQRPPALSCSLAGPGSTCRHREGRRRRGAACAGMRVTTPWRRSLPRGGGSSSERRQPATSGR